jgi:hypothetical protein
LILQAANFTFARICAAFMRAAFYKPATQRDFGELRILLAVDLQIANFASCNFKAMVCFCEMGFDFKS